MICYSSATASTLHDLLYICQYTSSHNLHIYQYISLPAMHLPVHFMVCYTSASAPHDLLHTYQYIYQYTSWSVVHLLSPVCRSCLLLLSFSPARGSGVHHSPSFKPASPHANLFRLILGNSVVSIHLFIVHPLISTRAGLNGWILTAVLPFHHSLWVWSKGPSPWRVRKLEKIPLLPLLFQCWFYVLLSLIGVGGGGAVGCAGASSLAVSF